MKIYDYKGRKNISGNRIREARLKKRLSQADFAAKLQIAGITMERDSVSRIEIGTRFVADYELMIIAEILDVTSTGYCPKTANNTTDHWRTFEPPGSFIFLFPP